MTLDNELEKLFLNVSIKAAYSSYHLVGKKDKNAADKAAVDSMRSELNKINMKGKIVIGEGELCLLYTSPSPRDLSTSRMPSSA